MKLLLKIHNKDRHSTTTAAVNLFQRKRKYHRRHSKSSSPVPSGAASLPASQQSGPSASSTPPHVSSSSLTSAASGAAVPCGTFDADRTTSGAASLAALVYGGPGNCTEPISCPIERRPLLRNSPSQSSARSFASSSRCVYIKFATKLF